MRDIEENITLGLRSDDFNFTGLTYMDLQNRIQNFLPEILIFTLSHLLILLNESLQLFVGEVKHMFNTNFRIWWNHRGAKSLHKITTSEKLHQIGYH